MGNKRRARVLFFGALALVAALLPAGLAAGSAGDDPTIVYLTLGRQDKVEWRGSVQEISTSRSSCTAISGHDGPILIISPGDDPEDELGFVRDGFGVKSPSDGFGDPCGRVDATHEILSVSLPSEVILEGYLMSAIDVDLELKFNASVDVIFNREGDEVARFDDFTGTGASDDGPDSGDGDNFRFNYTPGVLFDEVVFIPTAGSLTLDGGADRTDPASAPLDPESNSSQFKVVPTRIGCIDSVDIVGEGFQGTVNMEALLEDGMFQTDCEGSKGFEQAVTRDGPEGSLTFTPSGSDPARFTLILTIEDQPIETIDSGDLAGQITSLILEYDNGSGSGFQPLRPCLKVATGLDFGQAELDLLPGAETACFYHAEVRPTGQNVGIETWLIYFEDDPGFNFR